VSLLKKNKIMRRSIIILLFLLIHSVLCIAQKNNDLKDLNIIEQLDLFNVAINQVDASIIPKGNRVLINQIGINNSAILNVSSSQSNVEVLQTGRNNLVDLSYYGTEINSIVKQDGIDNSVLDYVFSLNDPINTFITQDGSNLHIEKFGSNSITNGLQINMTGSDKTVIINSFN
jgi:hypothetical protein